MGGVASLTVPGGKSEGHKSQATSPCLKGENMSFYFWKGARRAGKWTAILSSMMEVWRQGRETVMVTRLDADHYFEKVYWFNQN